VITAAIGLNTIKPSHRNATPNARARHALMQKGVPNACMELLVLRITPLASHHSYPGTDLVSQIRKISPCKNVGPLGKWPQDSLPTNLPRRRLNCRPRLLHELARLSVSPAMPRHHLGCCLNLGRARLRKLRYTTLLGLCFHHFLHCFLSYPQGFLPSPTSHYYPWEPSDSNSLTQQWGSWT